MDNLSYIRAAEKAAAFIIGRMHRPDGTLRHRFRDGEAGIAATIDDYAFFTFALIELYEATWNASYLEMALELTDLLIAEFKDQEHGGFFFTARHEEEIIVRQKEIFEGAMPSGNSMAIWNMLRLGRMTARPSLLDEAWGAASCFYDDLLQSPGAYAQFMVALDFAFGPSREVVIVGDSGKQDTDAMIRAVRSLFLTHTLVIFRPAGEASPLISHIIPFTKGMKNINGRATAYVCANDVCQQPTTNIRTMKERIGEMKAVIQR